MLLTAAGIMLDGRKVSTGLVKTNTYRPLPINLFSKRVLGIGCHRKLKNCSFEGKLYISINSELSANLSSSPESHECQGTSNLIFVLLAIELFLNLLTELCSSKKELISDENDRTHTEKIGKTT